MSNAQIPVRTDRIALIYLRPSDVVTDATLIYSESELHDHYFADDSPVKKFWSEVSHDNYQYTGKVFYPDKLPVTGAQIKATGEGYVTPAVAKAVTGGLTVPGLDPSQYDLFMILLAESPIPGPAGYELLFGGGYTGSTIVINGQSVRIRELSFVFRKFTSGKWFSVVPEGSAYTGPQNHDRLRYPQQGLWDEDSTMLHEWGHSIGLYAHAHYLRVTQEPMCGEVELSYGDLGDDYGNYFDIMGNSHYATHINAAYQDKLGWYGPTNIVRMSASQTNVRLSPLESNGTVRAAQIIPPRPIDLTLPSTATEVERKRFSVIAASATFYVEYRQAIGFDEHLGHPYLSENLQGVFINLAMPGMRASGVESWLLDMSPEPNPASSQRLDDHHHAALVAGYRFYDPTSQTLIGNIRPDGLNGVTFDVALGEHPNVPPGVSVEPASPSTSAPAKPRYRVGDTHPLGGIVAKVDATGEHGWLIGTEDLGRYTYEEAIKVCKEYRGGGWSLPEIQHLEEAHRQLVVNMKMGSFLPGLYRSVTSSGYPSYPWSLDFRSGIRQGDGLKNKTDVRPGRAF